VDLICCFILLTTLNHIHTQAAPHLILANLFKRVIASTELTNLEELASGAFGLISRATWRGRVVAIKSVLSSVVHGARSAVLLSAELINEGLMMKSLRHKNIVRLCGVMHSPSLALVMEYCAGGDLWSFTNKMQSISIVPSVVRRAIATDIARAMAFLHSQQPSIVHRDLRPPNVFLVSNVTSTLEMLVLRGDVIAKIGDFGMSQCASPCLFEPLQSWPWMAPETRGSHVRYNEMADVYSFAMVLYSMLTHSVPFNEFGDNDIWRVQREIVRSNLRPTLPIAVNNNDDDGEDTNNDDALLIELIHECWRTDAVKRPLFMSILQRLAK
jgi:serine/threonine protein kinase